MSSLRVLGCAVVIVLLAALPSGCLFDSGDDNGNGGNGGQDGVIAVYTGPGLANTRGVAFDGTNFLVTIQGRDLFGQGGGQIGLQLVDPTGRLLGSLVNAGWTGGSPLAAFGTRFLVIGPDDVIDSDVYGLFVTTRGDRDGDPFLITTGAEVTGCDGLATDGTGFLAVYCDRSELICGRVVSASGEVGDRIEISGGPAFTDGHNTAAYGGGAYLVAWADAAGPDIRARIVNTDGTLRGSEFTVLSRTSTEIYVHVGSDGDRFLVVCGGRGRFVSSAGAVQGEPLGVPGIPVGFDGENFLLLGASDSSAGDYDAYYRYLDREGGLVGERIAVATGAGNQIPTAGAYGNGQYLIAWCDGVTLDPWRGDNVYAKLVPKLP